MVNDRKKLKFWELDFSIPILVTLISAFSLVALTIVNTAPFTGEERTFLDYWEKFNFYYAKRQLLWYLIGIALMAFVTWLDYTSYKDLLAVAYWICVAMLGAVLFVNPVKGMSGRFVIGNQTFQPSEVTKLVIIMFLAKKIAGYENGIQTVGQLLPVLFYAAIPILLILGQPDLGTALVFAAMIICMLVLGGTNPKILMWLAIIGVVGIVASWFLVIRNVPYMYNRIMDFVDPMRAGADATSRYQLSQSQVAIGSGQFSGKGVFSAGSMSQLNFVPEQLTDFIFSVVGETFGFVGGAALIFLYMLLIFRMIWMSARVYDKYGSLIIVGVMGMMMFHIFESIAMTMGLMPITGIPLPFMSYGGSSMWTNMLSLGLVGSVWWRRSRFRAENTGKTLEFSPERNV